MHVGSDASAAGPGAPAPHASAAKARVAGPVTGKAAGTPLHPLDRPDLPEVRKTVRRLLQPPRSGWNGLPRDLHLPHESRRKTALNHRPRIAHPDIATQWRRQFVFPQEHSGADRRAAAFFVRSNTR